MTNDADDDPNQLAYNEEYSHHLQPRYVDFIDIWIVVTNVFDVLLGLPKPLQEDNGSRNKQAHHITTDNQAVWPKEIEDKEGNISQKYHENFAPCGPTRSDQFINKTCVANEWCTINESDKILRGLVVVILHCQDEVFQVEERPLNEDDSHDHLEPWAVFTTK